VYATYTLDKGSLVNSKAKKFEDDTGDISADRFVVISGCSGGGKSTLINELRRRGYRVVEEPGRRIVALRTGRRWSGTALG
jgi:putative ribosome biogenesis GTPase RsgA